jgi:ribonuclease-3
VADRHPLEPFLQSDLTGLARLSQAKHGRLAERIGHEFTDRELLRHALTHASSPGRAGDYQRLEFLGDRVLGLVIAEALFQQDRKAPEGELSARHSALVRREACAQVGHAIGLAEFVIMGEGEIAKRLNQSNTVMADVIEALIGALYLDGGLDAARRFILGNWAPLIEAGKVIRKDAKTFLQEWALAHALPIPVYRIVAREGPEHAPSFAVEVEIKGRAASRGSGPSKRLAEQDAAENFLRRENIR